MTRQPRRLAVAVLAVLALLTTACGREPLSREPATPSVAPSTAPVPGHSPGKLDLPDPGTGAKVASRTELAQLPGGRSYYLVVPTCTGSPDCAAWLATPRKLVVWLHGAGESEEPGHVNSILGAVGRAMGDGVVTAYGMTADGTLRWDADICCTATQVDEVGYLNDVVDDAASRVAIDPDGVGLAGASNGGMLATKAICAEPERFAAAAIWAASWRGPCDRGPVRIGHWHGDADPIIPLRGGRFPVDGRIVEFPPADWLRGRLAPGSELDLTVLPGVGHVEMPPAQAQEMLAWLGARL